MTAEEDDPEQGIQGKELDANALKSSPNVFPVDNRENPQWP
jgi:hypothetical protein